MQKQLQSIFDNPSERGEDLAGFLRDADSCELAEILFHFNPEEKVRIFRSLPDEKKRHTLLYETDEESRGEITRFLGDEELACLLAKMPERDTSN